MSKENARVKISLEFPVKLEMLQDYEYANTIEEFFIRYFRSGVFDKAIIGDIYDTEDPAWVIEDMEITEISVNGGNNLVRRRSI